MDLLEGINTDGMSPEMLQLLRDRVNAAYVEFKAILQPDLDKIYQLEPNE